MFWKNPEKIKYLDKREKQMDKQWEKYDKERKQNFLNFAENNEKAVKNILKSLKQEFAELSVKDLAEKGIYHRISFRQLSEDTVEVWDKRNAKPLSGTSHKFIFKINKDESVKVLKVENTMG